MSASIVNASYRTLFEEVEAVALRAPVVAVGIVDSCRRRRSAPERPFDTSRGSQQTQRQVVHTLGKLQGAWPLELGTGGPPQAAPSALASRVFHTVTRSL